MGFTRWDERRDRCVTAGRRGCTTEMVKFENVHVALDAGRRVTAMVDLKNESDETWAAADAYALPRVDWRGGLGGLESAVADGDLLLHLRHRAAAALQYGR